VEQENIGSKVYVCSNIKIRCNCTERKITDAIIAINVYANKKKMWGTEYIECCSRKKEEDEVWWKLGM
jgi:hypothetical protein